MKPHSYREQKCCGTCRFVFEDWDYDGPLDYYCHQDGSKRPRSGNPSPKEEWPSGRGIQKMLSVAWNRWAKPRKVEFHGVCDEWKEK
jgi:hypothetical protein